MDQQKTTQSPCPSASKEARLIALAEGLSDSHPRAMLAGALARVCNLPNSGRRLTTLMDYVRVLGDEIRAAKLTDQTWDHVQGMLEIALGHPVSLKTLQSQMARNYPLSVARERFKDANVDKLRRDLGLSFRPNDQPRPEREVVTSSLPQKLTHQDAGRGPTPPVQPYNDTSNPFMGPR